MPKCNVCDEDSVPLLPFPLGACGHALCADCGANALRVGLEDLAVCGVALPLSVLAESGLAAAEGSDEAGGGTAAALPGLLCQLCLPSAAARRAYAASFAAACRARALPSGALLAATAAGAPAVAVDEHAWAHGTAEHGLPPGWVAPRFAEAAFAAAAAAGAPLPAGLEALYARAAVPAVVFVAPFAHERAAHAEGVAEAWDALGGAGAAAASEPPPSAHVHAHAHAHAHAAAPAAPAIAPAAARQMSSARPVMCPNETCEQLLAIDARVEGPRHLSCPGCLAGFCAACGLAWTASAGAYPPSLPPLSTPNPTPHTELT